MNILIVYSHPNPASFNHAIKEQTENQIKDLGHTVKVRDLYQLGFNPVLSGNDFVGIKSGNIPEPIKAEQEYITWAETIIFIHPIWWAGMPAILKGYIDRVFALNFAYSYENFQPKGLLDGKKALVINTSGAPGEYYQESGMTNALGLTIDEGVYKFCAIEVIDHFFYGAVPAVTDDVRKGYLEDLSEKINKYFSWGETWSGNIQT